MQARTLHTWIARHIAVRTRLAQVGVSYLLFLMVVTRKHSLEEAARFSGLHKSQFSKFLHTHSPVAITTLQHLSTKQAKRLSKTLHNLSQHQLPWNGLPTASQKMDIGSASEQSLLKGTVL